MRETRFVPTTEPMFALTSYVVHDNRHGPNQPFFEYMSEHGLMRHAGMASDVLAQHLTALPPCEASTAFAAAAQVALDLTAADVLRPYDHVVMDSPAEQAAIADVDSLRENLEESSPLLVPVADILMRAPSSLTGESVHEVQTWLACVTGPTLRTVPTTEGYCDRHQEYDCTHADHSEHISWDHVEFIAPGTRATIAAAAQVIADALPTVGKSDNGKARMSPEYWERRNGR